MKMAGVTSAELPKSVTRLRKRINSKFIQLLEKDQRALDLMMALVFHEDNSAVAIYFAQTVVNDLDDATVEAIEELMDECRNLSVKRDLH
ncbi:hypothetical protein [Rhizobium sp. 2MFCol3.1]|uniref:hypothetical protein n=1 Tax=Rhizobium sp. 2MFCol3.1 TaxID=1246459 RepID=UPI00036E93F1|nr:hypothetical protein [Rhizobium sp. 2MFCol3.1]